MPEAVAMPQKRILSDTTSNSRNVMPPSPNASKKRKLLTNEPITNINVPARRNGPKAFGSSQSQQKSQFEEVLERLGQDISGLKQTNSEKDQDWERPPLEGLDENRDTLCFQQIDVSEGTLDGGGVTIKLFGVTEVSYILFLLFPNPLKGYL
jgi:DNA polymerase delta subunit 1